MGGIFDDGNGEVDFAWAVVGGGGDGVEAWGDFGQEGGKFGGIDLEALGIGKDIDGIAVGHIGVQFGFVGANFLKAIPAWAGGRFFRSHFYKLFACPVEDGGSGDGFGEGGVPRESEFS